MFCQNCVAKLNEGSSFYSTCAKAGVSSQHAKQQNGTGLIGFSSKINDPGLWNIKTLTL